MITKKLFDKYDGKDVYAYTLSDNVQVTIATLGATVLSLRVQDKNGEFVDVVLGKTDAHSLLRTGSYMGAIVGRCANRIEKGAFTLNGKSYHVTQNNGVNSLHGGERGFNTKVFDVIVDERANSVTFSAQLRDGEDGYPANFKLSVKYTVKASALTIDYCAESDGDTLCNPTSHMYFNLNGESDGNALDNNLRINADSYLQVDDTLIPTVRASVTGTPFDFREFKPIGRDIDANDAQLRIANGYDHSFCLDGNHAATAFSPKTGVQMDVYTDMEGMQLYTGNFLSDEVGKSVYGKHSGFCLETQFYPNAINRSDCAKPILKQGEQFHSQTTFIFSVRR